MVWIFIIGSNLPHAFKSEENTQEDWAKILDVCDKVKEDEDGPKECIKSLTKKLENDNPRVALQAITVNIWNINSKL